SVAGSSWSRGAYATSSGNQADTTIPQGQGKARQRQSKAKLRQAAQPTRYKHGDEGLRSRQDTSMGMRGRRRRSSERWTD
ncbi:unnamed protein product, partial [Ascophyllum nodosum]